MRIIVSIVCLFSATLFCVAQQSVPPPNSPIELPEFLVTGKEAVDIATGTKRSPQRPPLLSPARLDSLNPTEKQPLPPLPPRTLPTYVRTAVIWPGYLQADIGNYLTPLVQAGYSFVAGGYRLDCSGDLHASNGWVDNSGYLVGGLRVLSSYVAPEKFILFGGSTTQADVGYQHQSYRLFARPDALERTLGSFKAGIDVEGRADAISYQASAFMQNQALSTVSMRDVSDNVISGKLRVEQQWKSTDVGVMVDMRLQTYASNSYPFVEAGAFARWTTESIRISGGAGLQWATSTQGIDRFGVAIVGQADVIMGWDLTLIAVARSGMRPVTFADLLRQNPYIDDAVGLDAAYDLIDLRVTLLYHPSVRTSVSAGMRLRQTDREPVWISARSGLFTVEYRSVSIMEINADARFLISPRDVVLADIWLTSASVMDASTQPYVPSIRMSAEYQRTWTEKFRSGLGIVYIGRRYADLATQIALGGYADIRLNASYAITSSLDIQARAENILGSTIVLWESYRERGIFVTAGITWKF